MFVWRRAGGRAGRGRGVDVAGAAMVRNDANEAALFHEWVGGVVRRVLLSRCLAPDLQRVTVHM